MSSRIRAALVACAVALALAAGACGGAASDAESDGLTATATGSVAAAPAGNRGVSPARSTPSAARAMAHLRTLAGDIGSRPATTDAERRAADYIRTQLEAAGYQVALEGFDVQATLGGTATLQLNEGTTLEGSPLSGSPDGTVRGETVFAGLGRPADLAGVQASGKVVLLDRGEITFAEKVRNAQAAGAIAVIVVNNEAGLFRGDLGGEPVRVPAISAARESREALRRPFTSVSIEVYTNRVTGRSHNVVAKPSSAPCTAYLGGHYDSVPAGPGANDNASGTSLLLELARVRRVDGVCIVAFGAEEVGLFGSRAFVQEHEVGDAAFMMNFDMVAKMTRPTFIGDATLTDIAADVAEQSDVDVRTVTSFGPGASSDHASFQAAGVPVLMFYSGDDEFIHTAQDNLENVSEDDLGRFLEVAVEVLDRLLAG